MKLTTLLFLISVFNIQASSYSQNTKITLKLKSVKVMTVLESIESLTEFKFLGNENIIDKTRIVSVNVKNKRVDAILNELFDNSNIDYNLIGKQVVLFENKSTVGKAIEDIKPMILQNVVTGTVVDATGEPLPGANVLEKGTTNGQQTDFDGKFTIRTANENAVLVVSYIGYKTKEIPVKGKSDFSIILEENASSLEEVVLVGYGTQKKSSVTGSVASVSVKKLTEIPVANLSDALAGVTLGALVTKDGGKPGKASSLSIRAAGSFNGSNPVLYIIDGVARSEYDFNQLNANDVENLSILKDAAASAIYGSRAANGVVLVSTKKGTIGAPVINYTASYSTDEPTRLPKTQSTLEYAKHINNALKNKLVLPTNAGYISPDELEYFGKNNFSFWEDISKNPTTVTHSLNVQGGTKGTKYFIGGTYYKGTGIVKHIENSRYSLRANVSSDLSENLNVSLNLNTNSQEDEKPFWRWDGDNDNFADFFRNSQLRGALSPAYINGLPTGNFNSWHPGEVANGSTGVNLRENLVSQATLKLDYKIPFVDGLKFGVLYNVYQRQIWDKEVNTPYNTYRFVTTGTNNHILTDVLQDPSTRIRERNDGNWIWQRNQRLKSYQLNFTLNYQKTFGDHTVGATFIYEQNENSYDQTRAQRNNLLSSAIQQINFGNSEDQFANGSASEGGRLSYAGRIAYNYKERYFIESSFRYDGSAFFRKEQQYGLFPSVSGAWNISKEDFFKIDAINSLKLKGSVGILGDESNIGLASWQQLHNQVNGPVFGNGSSNRVNATGPGSLASDNITWEKNTSVNYGVEAAFLNNRLTTSFEIFKTKRESILDNNTATVSTIAGFSLPRENTGRVDTKGIEFGAGFRDNLNENFSYYVTTNVAYATNKLIDRVENAGIRAHRSRLNRTLGLIEGYTSAGILRTQADIDALPADFKIFGQNPELGMLNYVDLRGADSDTPDGKIDGNDSGFIGESIPKLRYGFSLGAKYKNWSIDAIFQGLGGFDKMLAYRAQADHSEGNNYAFWNDAWSPDNTDGAYPRAYGWGGPQGQEHSQQASTFWLEKGDFLRLKNLNIGYELPEVFLQKMGVSRAKIYFNGTNLFLLKSNTKLYDPEGNINTYPLVKNLAIGLNVSI